MHSNGFADAKHGAGLGKGKREGGISAAIISAAESHQMTARVLPEAARAVFQVQT